MEAQTGFISRRMPIAHWKPRTNVNGGAAVIYSLIETAKLNGVNPQAWLTHVIENIADHPMKQIDELLPWKYSAD